MTEHIHHDDPFACLKQVPIFAELSEAEHLELALITTAKMVKKGDFIYLQGDPGGTLYVLHEGRVKVSRVGLSGKEQVIRIIGPGDFLGELSLLSGETHTDMAEATAKSTMCMIEGDRLKALMEKNGTIAVKISEALSRRLEQAEHRIEAINLNTVQERLVGALLDLSSGRDRFSLPLTKRDLASLLGMTQETLSRTLTTLQQDGLIDLSGQRGIVILDRMALEGMR